MLRLQCFHVLTMRLVLCHLQLVLGLDGALKSLFVGFCLRQLPLHFFMRPGEALLNGLERLSQRLLVLKLDCGLL